MDGLLLAIQHQETINKYPSRNITFTRAVPLKPSKFSKKNDMFAFLRDAGRVRRGAARHLHLLLVQLAHSFVPGPPAQTTFCHVFTCKKGLARTIIECLQDSIVVSKRDEKQKVRASLHAPDEPEGPVAASGGAAAAAAPAAPAAGKVITFNIGLKRRTSVKVGRSAPRKRASVKLTGTGCKQQQLALWLSQRWC